jgi:hypothetical protein
MLRGQADEHVTHLRLQYTYILRLFPRLIPGLHDLKLLNANCRAHGASSPLLRLLANPGVRLRKLVQRPS